MRKSVLCLILIALMAPMAPVAAHADIFSSTFFGGETSRDGERVPPSIFGMRSNLEPIPQEHSPFIFPNETQPTLARSIFSKTNTGVYVAVGTERGFMSAALANSQYLLLVDYNDEVVLYNRLTILLLKLSADLPQFRKMKTEPDGLKQEWDRLPLGTLTPKEYRFLELALNSGWWRTLIQRGQDIRYNTAEFFKPAEQTGHFVGANYLYENGSYQKLKDMASAGRIEAHKVDLSVDSDVKNLVHVLEHTHLPLSVMDISNGWMQGYIGSSKTELLIRRLQPVSQPTSVLLLNDRARASEARQHHEHYRYIGFTFRYLSQHALQVPSREPGYMGDPALDFADNALVDVAGADADASAGEAAPSALGSGCNGLLNGQQQQ